MLDLEAREIIEEDYYDFCERCGEKVLAEEMRHAYPHNGFESYGEAVYSECLECAEHGGW